MDQRAGHGRSPDGAGGAPDADDREEPLALLLRVGVRREAPELGDGDEVEIPTHKKNGTPRGTPRDPSAQNRARFAAKNVVTLAMSTSRRTRAASQP